MNREQGELKNCLFMLAYFKQLALHPHLLSKKSLHCKKSIGLLTNSEELELNEINRVREEEAKDTQVGILTRR